MAKTKNKDDSFAPEVVGGTLAALLAAESIRKGSPRKALAPMVEGAKDVVRGGGLAKRLPLNKYVRSGLDLARKGANKARGNFSDFEEFVAMAKKKSGMNYGDDLPKERMKELYKEFREGTNKMDSMVDKAYESWASRQGVKKPLRKLTKTELNDFMQEMDEAYKKSDFEFYKEPKNFVKKKRKGTFKEDALKGLGAGSAFGTSSFLVHALGEKYFDEMDNDKIRKAVRDSYKVNQDKPLPLERAEMLTKRAFAENLGGRASRVAKNVGEKAKAAGKSTPELLLGTLLDSAILTAIPASISLALNRDIRNNFQKIDGEDDDSRAITIDVPMKNLQKKASMKETIENAIKHEGAREFLRRRKETMIRSVPWVLGPGLLTIAAGKDLRGDLSPAQSEPAKPLEDGYARITIQTKPNAPSNRNSYMMKRASEKDPLDELIEALTKDLDKKKEVMPEPNLSKAVNFKPSHNIIGRNYQERMQK